MDLFKRSFRENLFRLRTYSGRWAKSSPVKSGAPIAICCVFKNEGPYLDEWIRFYLQQGVSKFYLIDNHSEDNFREVVEPYIQQGVVRLLQTRTKGISVPIQSMELSRGLNVIKKELGSDCWISTLDIDEFLYPTGKQSLRELLDAQAGEPRAGVLINWMMFGTSGVKKLDPGKSMLEQLTRRAPEDLQDHLLFKPMLYGANVYRLPNGPHLADHMKGANYIYCDGEPFTRDNYTVRHHPFCVNHYWYRSEEYYYQKKIAKKKAFGVARNKPKAEAWHMEYCNRVEDRRILEYLESETKA